jgi:hypothetical protein
MPDSSKKRARPPAKRPAKRVSASHEPSLRFYHSSRLRAETLAVLRTLEQARDGTQHHEALSDVVVALTESGMEYYFLRPLKLAKVGFVVEQSARLGMKGALRVQASIVRNIIGRMDGPQLLTICGYIRNLME